MKTLRKVLFNSIFLTVLLFGSCMEEGLRGPAGPIGDSGTSGPGGDKGDDGMGNVNVLKYTIDIPKANWVQTSLGDGNTVMAYEIPTTLTGNISLLDDNYVVYAYGQPMGYPDYPQRKILPYVFGYKNQYGIRIELLLGDGSENAKAMAAISKAIGGYGNGALIESEIPASIRIDIFLIKITNPSDLEGLTIPESGMIKRLYYKKVSQNLNY